MIRARILAARHRERVWARWGLAVLFLALAESVQLPLRAVPASGMSETFLPALLGAAVLCGLAPALVMLALSILIFWLAWPTPAAPGAGALLATVLEALNSAFAIVITSVLVTRLRASRQLVRQQETLFRELQHRVANSLQFIAGTLDIARRHIRTAEDADLVLAQASTRVSLTGQLHRRLNDASHYAAGLTALLREILADLFLGMEVEVRIVADGVAVAPSQMTPIVLLVTEAATNALKYAFRDRQGNVFDVSVTRQGRDIRLAIADNGPGLPGGEISGRGLGMQIMRGLASQLGGALVVSGERGMRIEVVFPVA